MTYGEELVSLALPCDCKVDTASNPWQRHPTTPRR